MFFAFFVLAGLVTGWLGRGSLRGLALLPLRYGWLIALALLAKVLLFSAFFADSPLAAWAPLFYILINLALLAGVFINRSLPGIKLLAAGLLLNFVVIAANGGYMPVSAAAMEAAGYPEDAAQLRGMDRLVTVRELTDETVLPLLADRFALPPPLPFRGAISLGDLLIGAGAFWLVARAMVGSRGKGQALDPG